MDIPHAEQQKCHWHLNLQGINIKAQEDKSKVEKESPEAKTISASPFSLLGAHCAFSTVLFGCACGKNINPSRFQSPRGTHNPTAALEV